MSIKDLERRLGVLEDIEEIKRLKARYCGSCDTSYDADGLSSLFAENGLMDDGWRGGGGGGSPGKGRDTQVLHQSRPKGPLRPPHGHESHY